MRLKHFIFLPFLFIIMAGCDGCKKPCPDIDETVLTGYNSIAHQTLANPAVEEIDCYLDYSDGMQAKSVAVANNYDNLINFLKGKRVSYYKVGKVDDLPSITASDADFRNSANYTDPISKLMPAIKNMAAAKNKTSIFITDFEKIEGHDVPGNPQGPTPFLKLVDNTAWAQTAFKEWLLAGNQIDIFGMPYSAGGVNNHIYAIVFTPAEIVKKEEYYKNSLLRHMLDNFSNNPHFTYSVSSYKVDQGKTAEEIGNANDNSYVLENITKTKDKGFEYYAFSSSELVKLNNDEEYKDDRRLINKLKITSQNESLSNVQFGIKAYDITASLQDFTESKNQEPPEIKTDAETGRKDTLNKTKGYTYQKGTSVEDVFDVVYNKETAEIGIKLKPDFTGVSECTVYQVDIVATNVKLKDFSNTEILSIHYPDNFTINPLGKSIEYAMKDAVNGTADKVLYTVYIKIEK